VVPLFLECRTLFPGGQPFEDILEFKLDPRLRVSVEISKPSRVELKCSQNPRCSGLCWDAYLAWRLTYNPRRVNARVRYRPGHIQKLWIKRVYVGWDQKPWSPAPECLCQSKQKIPHRWTVACGLHTTGKNPNGLRHRPSRVAKITSKPSANDLRLHFSSTLEGFDISTESLRLRPKLNKDTSRNQISGLSLSEASVPWIEKPLCC
jgi:hypothetical protein